MGDVITFYSYKGGVGRTFLMANIAAVLSLWGYKTLCIDWDLEAPGLHHYYKEWLKNSDYKGLLELIKSFKAKKNVDWKKYVLDLKLPGSKASISFMFAGKIDHSYTEKIQDIDWDELYDKGFGNYLEKMRKEWKENYDFILIDSRTGITDIGGICTIQLPDIIAFVFAANTQSLEGAVNVVNRVMIKRNKLPYDRAGLIAIPIISRLDSREDPDSSDEWLKIIEKMVSPIVSTWKNKTVRTIDLLYKLVLPYFPRWSFGEKLPVIVEKRDDNESINYSFKTLASLIAHGISKSEELVSMRDLYVKSASLESQLVSYRVTITPAEKENAFNICWINLRTNTLDCFVQESPGITARDVDRLWQNQVNALEIGRKLFRFLDGEARHLERALEESAQQSEPLLLLLSPCKESEDLPFELLSRDDSFLLPHRMHLVRYISGGEKEIEFTPRDSPLKLLFMACAALDVKPELDFEKEEESIFHNTENIAIDVEVEDSGSLEGLGRRLEQEQYDVVHLSGHADIDKHGRPFFIMEDETGKRKDVLPEKLWQEALIENPPRLLFLSGNRTGETPDKDAGNSFAGVLAENYQTPAILSWSRPISDQHAMHAAKMIYRELSRGKSILEALQRARYELIKNFPTTSYPAQCLLRLYSSHQELNAIVSTGHKIRVQPRRLKYTYLKQSRVQVLEQGFVGRRRQLQASLRTLMHDHEKIGVLLHGTGGLGKSCLAGKICERFEKHHLIIIHGRLNSITMAAALKDAFINTWDETGQKLLAAEAEMTDKLAKLCTSSFKQKNYLILLDDFEQNLEGADRGQPDLLLPEAAELLEVLLHYLPFSGKMTQLIITCRYLFSLVGKGHDQVKQKLEPICLTSFQLAEQRKKVRELEHILNYPDKAVVELLVAAGQGNPRLMEWLDILVGEMRESEVPLLLEAVKDKREEFIRSHVIRELLHCGGDELARFLGRFAIYRQPVLIDGVREIGEKAGLKGWKELLQRGIELSLTMHDQAGESYGVTPILREELLTGVDSLKDCHWAAFCYYKKRCESMESVDAVLVVEWIYHALGCGEEETASMQGGRLVKHLRERLAFRESRRVGESVLAEKKQELSTGDDAFLLNEYAYTIYSLGDHRKAIEYYEQALAIRKKVYGEKHPQVASALNNLGEVWNTLGESRKAIEYYEQALAIRERVYGEKHPQVASALNNLGEVWNTLGESRKAIEYYEQALAIDEAVFGKEHPDVAVALNNLGFAWNTLGEPRKAIEYHEQALAIDEAVFGKKHPNVSRELNNLGEAWKTLGELRKAIEYYEQALAIDEAVFGKEHPNVSRELNNLGEAWKTLGEPRKAIEYYDQALAIDEAVFGKEHPTIAIRFNNLGAVYFELGKNQKAKAYFEKAYKIFKKFFGNEHPHTKTVAQWLKTVTRTEG
jgi:tetratricopeptide (TPR) repeat protein/MinD-like ATPase involved in chromosome partitioning or flagellar assembly